MFWCRPRLPVFYSNIAEGTLLRLQCFIKRAAHLAQPLRADLLVRGPSLAGRLPLDFCCRFPDGSDQQQAPPAAAVLKCWLLRDRLVAEAAQLRAKYLHHTMHAGLPLDVVLDVRGKCTRPAANDINHAICVSIDLFRARTHFARSCWQEYTAGRCGD